MPPWNNLGMLVDTEIGGVDGLFEKSGSIRNEDCSGIDPGKVFNRGYKIRIVHTFAVLCCKGTDNLRERKRRRIIARHILQNYVLLHPLNLCNLTQVVP